MKCKIIVVDDEPDFLEGIHRGLRTSGYKSIQTESDPRVAAELLGNGDDFDVALIDITMPAMNGIELLEIIKNHHPNTECIMITALDEARTAVECLKKGAYDYLVKPISKENLLSAVSRALERKRLRDIVRIDQRQSTPELNNPEAFSAIRTRNTHMLKILKIAELHAGSDAPVLITGETGTGKELLSRAIHAASPRSQYPITPINMDALSETLFDDQFFGHTKGAFTGAEQDRAGFLESTHKGTLFLDEIGNLPLGLQGRLLRVLQNGEFIKIGTSHPRRVDVRFVAATNKNLDWLMKKNQFRKDLYYRLSGGLVHLPPLRERKDDIPLLVDFFLNQFRENQPAEIEPDAMNQLMAYDYPGNVRELKSIIKSAVNLAQNQPIHVACLPPQLQKEAHHKSTKNESPQVAPTLSELEKRHILNVYQMCNHNKAESARVLDIGINTLRRKLNDYAID